MKQVHIQSDMFFEMLKKHGKSMWEIFSQMINGEAQEIIFLNAQNQMMFSFILPENAEDLEAVRLEFNEKFKEKLRSMLN
ncbi:MAG: hypothetical protein Q4G27_09045 [Flavobacteriaceae bacterium]|nr:hypothetical protein [Flavobacteriaceae bacterium]